MKPHSTTAPPLPDHTHTHPPTHTHTHGCKCVFWLWKSCLYSFVVSGLTMNQITVMAAASRPSPPPPPPPPPPRLVATGPAGAQVALQGPPCSVSRLQMLLSIGLCVPQTSPMPEDQTHYRWSDIKTNRGECKALSPPCSRSHDSPC